MEYKIFTSVGMLTLNVPMHERATSTGERYMECPICTPLRKPEHRGEKKLAVNVQEGAWRCNHCEEGGYLHTDKEIEEKIKPLTYSPNYKPVNDGIYKFFNGRAISKATVRSLTSSSPIIAPITRGSAVAAPIIASRSRRSSR